MGLKTKPISLIKVIILCLNEAIKLTLTAIVVWQTTKWTIVAAEAERGFTGLGGEFLIISLVGMTTYGLLTFILNEEVATQTQKNSPKLLAQSKRVSKD